MADHDKISKQLGDILITGGAGFIGSHLANTLTSEGCNVTVIDNLSAGSLSNLSFSEKIKNFSFTKTDLNDLEGLKKALINVKTVFHLAAYPEVRTGYEHPEFCYKENIQNTFNLLEKIRHTNVENIFFTSSSTVYGEPAVIPTPENFGPLVPISPYGASKIASEALVTSYCHTYGIKGWIFRLANVIGSRSRHGVIWDFINKLKKNQKKMEILGDGKQTKSYIHVTDCIESFLHSISKTSKLVEIFNVGNVDQVNVISIAKIVCNKMKLENVELITTGGVENGRGWIGDVKTMHLDISKLKSIGWSPKLSSEQSIALATEELLREV